MMAENCQLPANVKHDKLITNNVSLLSKLQTHTNTYRFVLFQVIVKCGILAGVMTLDPVMPGTVCYGSWLDFDVSP